MSAFTNTNNTKVYVVILNWNGLSDTEECLRSLHSAVLDCQVVVVDNGSLNNEAEKLQKEYPFIHLIRNSHNEGYCRGNNQGIAYCLAQPDCECIMILNNDTTVDRDFLQPLVESVTKDKKNIVSPKLLYYDRPGTIQTAGGKIFLGGTYHIAKGKPSNYCAENIYPDAISGACFMADRQAFEDVGVFDENFFAYLEDVDWSVRARQKGYRLISLVRSLVFHKHSRSTQGSYKKAYYLGRNNIIFARKHYHGIRRILFIATSICVGLFMNLVSNRNISFFKYFFDGVTDGLHRKLRYVNGQ